MSARIEISMDEYNALRDQVKGTQGQLYKVSEENKHLKEQIQSLESQLETIRSLKFFERIFHWKSSIN